MYHYKQNMPKNLPADASELLESLRAQGRDLMSALEELCAKHHYVLLGGEPADFEEESTAAAGSLARLLSLEWANLSRSGLSHFAVWGNQALQREVDSLSVPQLAALDRAALGCSDTALEMLLTARHAGLKIVLCKPDGAAPEDLVARDYNEYSAKAAAALSLPDEKNRLLALLPEAELCPLPVPVSEDESLLPVAAVLAAGRPSGLVSLRLVDCQDSEQGRNMLLPFMPEIKAAFPQSSFIYLPNEYPFSLLSGKSPFTVGVSALALMLPQEDKGDE